ncbi:MAG: hypothetical protein CL777_02640 [Chloroflexi bacterium]|nr:hypothetical protein [Chloroflexota bacterium]MCH2532019.1 cupredoxin domain-containing protein [Dehalococcoidia bacterium]
MRTFSMSLVTSVALFMIIGCSATETLPTPTVTKVTDGEVNIIMNNYNFVPERLAFSTNEKVKFVMNSTDSVHSFTIRELGINWIVSRNDEPTIEEYTFTKPGTYQLICIISGHASEGMVGEVIVE